MPLAPSNRTSISQVRSCEARAQFNSHAPNFLSVPPDHLCQVSRVLEHVVTTRSFSQQNTLAGRASTKGSDLLKRSLLGRPSARWIVTSTIPRGSGALPKFSITGKSILLGYTTMPFTTVCGRAGKWARLEGKKQDLINDTMIQKVHASGASLLVPTVNVRKMSMMASTEMREVKPQPHHLTLYPGALHQQTYAPVLLHQPLLSLSNERDAMPG